MTCPTWVSRGACSNLCARFEENAAKKLRRHNMSEIHGKAIQAMINLAIEEPLIMENSNNHQCKKEGNNLHIFKLALIVHFVAHNNVPVKALQKSKI